VEDSTESKTKQFFAPGGEAKKITKWVASACTQEKRTDVSQVGTQTLTSKHSEENNEVITVDSNLSSASTSNSTNAQPPETPTQRAIPKIAAFQVGVKVPIFGSIPEGLSLNTAQMTASTTSQHNSNLVIPESVSVEASTPSTSTGNTTITSSPSPRQSSYKGVPHGHITTNNVPNETGCFNIPLSTAVKTGIKVTRF